GDNCADADHHDPEQLEAEHRAGRNVEDDVADVDEPANRREDPERDLEDLLHPLRSSSFRRTVAATSASSGWACSCANASETATARASSRRRSASTLGPAGFANAFAAASASSDRSPEWILAKGR